MTNAQGWTTTPEAPQQVWGPAWTTNPTAPQPVRESGWFALVEKIGFLVGDGDLDTAVAPRYATTVGLRGGGALTAVLAPRNYRAAALSGLGLPTGTLYETRPTTAFFTGSGAYGASSINDGLSGVIQVGYAAKFSGGGALHADIVGGHEVVDGLSATATGVIIDGLSATVAAVS